MFFFRFIIYSVIFYFFYSILKKILFFLKSNSGNSDVNITYKKNNIRKSQKRDIVDADFEEIKDKK
jgi:hypothetical protein